MEIKMISSNFQKMACRRVYLLVLFLGLNCIAVAASNACPRDEFESDQVSDKFTKCQCDGPPLRRTKITCTDQHFNGNDSRQMLNSLSNSAHLLDSLEELHFNGNDMEYLPPNVIGNSKLGVFWELDVLDLSRNNISAISGKSFHATPDLQALILDDNEWYVTDRAPRIFSSFFELKTLSLNNAFSSSPDTKTDIQVSTLTDVFEGSEMYWLEYLYLERNKLVEVHESIFQSLPSLRFLSLANNMIVSVHNIWNSSCHEKTYYTDMYKERCLLETLDLSSNRINVIPMALINELQLMKSFKSLNISDNPLNCDCNMAPFILWLQQNESNSAKIHQVHSLECKYPSHLKGKCIGILFSRYMYNISTTSIGLSNMTVLEYKQINISYFFVNQVGQIFISTAC